MEDADDWFFEPKCKNCSEYDRLDNIPDLGVCVEEKSPHYGQYLAPWKPECKLKNDIRIKNDKGYREMLQEREEHAKTN